MDTINYEELLPVDYFRKSTESEDRQALSLSSQKNECKRTKDYYRLQAPIAVFEESKSAKIAGKRPQFSEMMRMIKNGKVNTIICWHLNRLARNMTEGGEIIDLLSSGKIKAIITPTEIYTENNDVSVMSLHFGASKQYSKTLSKDVKRGQRTKAGKGVPHGVAAIGFINDKTEEKGSRQWLVDEVRLPIVKKLLGIFLEGRHSASALYEVAKNDLKLTTIQRKHVGGKPLSKSAIYTLLRNPIYAGFFSLEGKRYELTTSLPRLITEEEHAKIKNMISEKGQPRLTKRVGSYNPFMKCGVCSGILSHDFKFQIICTCKHKFSYLNKDTCPKCGISIKKIKNPIYLYYVYYYCVNNKKHRTTCSKSGIEEKVLEKQLCVDLEENLAISKELSKWCIENIGELKDLELEDAINIKRNLEQEKGTIENKLKRLTMLRISGYRSKEENDDFNKLEKELRSESSLLETRIKNTNVEWLTEAKEDFNLMSEITNTIKNGTIEQKKDLLYSLGSNLVISSKELNVINKKSIETFKRYLAEAKSKNKAFEPKKTLADKDKTEAFASVRTDLLSTVDAFRTANWVKIKSELQFSGVLNII